MQLRLTTQHFSLPRNSGAALASRARRALKRVGNGITALHLTLKDVDGPRGGRGKVCVLRAQLAGGGLVVVTERSAVMGRALVRCLRKSRLLIDKEIKRRQPARRHLRRALAAA